MKFEIIQAKKFGQFLKNTFSSNERRQYTFFIILFSILAIIARLIMSTNIWSQLIFHGLLIGIICVLIPALLFYLQIKKVLLQDCILIAAIIFLIVDPTQSLYLTALMSVIALGIKLFSRGKMWTRANPALIGISLVTIFFAIFSFKNLTVSVDLSWWGTSFFKLIGDYNLTLSALILITFGLYFAYKNNKLRIVVYSFIFLLILWILHYAILEHVRNFKEDMSSVLELVLSGTLSFGLFTILAHPHTSPHKIENQIFYALMFSLILAILYFYKIDNFVLYSLLAANIFYVAIAALPREMKFKFPKFRK